MDDWLSSVRPAARLRQLARRFTVARVKRDDSQELPVTSCFAQHFPRSTERRKQPARQWPKRPATACANQSAAKPSVKTPQNRQNRQRTDFCRFDRRQLLKRVAVFYDSKTPLAKSEAKKG